MTTAVAPPPREIRIAALPHQRAFIEDTSSEVLFSGAFGGAKTYAVCLKILAHALRYPGSWTGMCRKTLVDLKTSTLRTFLAEVLPPELLVRHHKSDHVITIRSGPDLRQESYVHYFGLVEGEGDSFNIRSVNVGACGVEEVVELTEREWEEIRARCRHPKTGVNQIFGATNPSSRGHWAYRRFFTERVPGVHGTHQATTFDNPLLPASYIAYCASLKGRYRDRYVLGKWVDFEGLVYDIYDPTVHALTWRQAMERFGLTEPKIPAEWMRFASCDLGYVNPTVYQWWAVAPDETYVRYREIYHSHVLVEHHAARILALQQGEPEPVAVYADHDAEDRATLVHHGVETQAANKEKLAGIQTVYELLQPDKVTGRPRCYFLRDDPTDPDAPPVLDAVDPLLEHQRKPTSTLAEFDSYRYPPGTAKANAKEEPIKLDDHGMDCSRYGLHSFSRGGGASALLRAYDKMLARAESAKTRDARQSQ